MKLSDEAEFIIELLRKKFQMGEISGFDVMIEIDEFENDIGYDSFENALYELENENYLTNVNSFNDGSFGFELRMKGKKAISLPKETLQETKTTCAENGIQKNAEAFSYSPKELVVMAEYPQFEKDYQILLNNGYIAKVNGELKWQKSKSSLADYFASQNLGRKNWHVIENLFGEKGLCSIYKNVDGTSKDFKELKKLLKV